MTEIQRRNLKLEKILLTHAHLDHAAGTARLAALCKIPIEGPHPDDQFLIDELPAHAARYGFPPSASFTPDRYLADGDRVTLGGQELEVIHCPGHTPGHVVFFHAAQRLAWVGDVLFAGFYRPKRLPRGNHTDLINSIRRKLFPLARILRSCLAMDRSPRSDKSKRPIRLWRITCLASGMLPAPI